MIIHLGKCRQMIAAACLVFLIFLSACARSPEARSAKYLEAGKKLLEKNDPGRAILQFRSAVQATPRNPEAYYQLSQAFFAAGDLPAGVLTLRKTLEINPKHRGAQLRMAELMSMASDPKLVTEARDRLRKMLQEAPNDADTLHALAFTEVKMGKPDDAVQYLARAMVLAPRDLTLSISLAEAKILQKDVQGAEKVLTKASQDAPRSTEASFFLGRFYASQNRWTEAEQQYNRALSIDPKNAEALFNLADLQDRAGRKQEAEQNYKRLSELPNGSYRSLHALYIFREGRKDEAIRELEFIVKASPDDRAARTRLIAAYQSAGRSADVERTLDGALKKNPKDSEALLQRGELFIAGRKFDQAERDLNQVLRLNPDSAQVHYILAKFHQSRGESLTYQQELFKAVQLDGNLLSARIEAAQTLVAKGDPKGALSLIDSAPQSQKSMTPLLIERNWALWAIGDMAGMRSGIDLGLSQGRDPEFLLQQGVWKLRAGKFPEAKKSLEEGLNIHPGDVRALAALNQAYRADNHAGVALQRVREYAAREPKSAPVQEFLGVLLAVNGDKEQARNAFEAAKAADPKRSEADLSLIQMDVLDGKLDAARTRLKSLLANDPSNTTARLWLGNVDLSKGDRNAALDDYRRVVAADPNNAQGLNNYAYLLAQSGDQLTEAFKYAQKARELAPGQADYSDTLGWILYREGQYPTAVSELERASNADGKNAISRYHLAMAYAKVGDTARGRTALRAALKLDPNATEAKIASDMLRK